MICNCISQNCPCRSAYSDAPYNPIRYCSTCGVAMGYALSHNHPTKEDLDTKAEQIMKLIKELNKNPDFKKAN